MLFRYDCRAVSPLAGEAPEDEGCCGPRRLERLKKLSGSRLAETRSAQRLCRELWEAFPGAAGSGGFVLEEDRNGKPFLLRSTLYVSLSHSGGYAAAAVADVPLGIDLQILRDISPRVLKRLYSPEELRWIGLAQGEDVRERAIRLWTMKEAYGKLTGTGILGARAFCAGFDSERLQREYSGCRFLFPAAPEGLLLTVCLEEKEGRVPAPSV